MRFLEEKILEKREAEKRRENEKKIKEGAINIDQNLESEYLTIEEYGANGELLKKIDEKTGKITEFRGGMPVPSTTKLLPKQKNVNPFSPPESDDSDSSNSQ